MNVAEEKDTKMYNYIDLMQIMNCSKTMSHRLIRQLNQELSKQGCLTLKGKISKSYINSRFNLS